MRLRVATPTKVIVDREVAYVQAEDASGRFGILEGHEHFLTALVPSILVYRHGAGGAEHEGYVAVRQGVLRVTKEGVHVAVRDAQATESLEALQDEVRRARKNRTGRSYRASRSLYQMQLAAWRQLMEFEDDRSRR